jgi:hypothetical protein
MLKKSVLYDNTTQYNVTERIVFFVSGLEIDRDNVIWRNVSGDFEPLEVWK